MSTVRVRFAPSPTGIPHVGNIRTALFDYFAAKHSNGNFILRIEDTDQARKVEGATESIKESLNWLDVFWDEFVVQSDRIDEYKSRAVSLVKKGLAREENGAIRFIVPKEKGSVSWIDAVGNKEISFSLKDVEDFIILKADGFPTYHLANVIDDHLMEITHVIRGEDWIPSTPKHLLLYRAFGWDAPVFAHVPNVLGIDGKKLSKRRGAKSVLDFKKEGYLPEALLNYLMLLGWSPKDDREILSKEEITSEFTLEKVNDAPAVFDERKLLWMNGEYIRKTDNQTLKKLILDFDSSLIDYDQDVLDKLIEPAKTRIKKLSEFKGYVTPFIKPMKKESELLKKIAANLTALSEWKKENILDVLIKFMQENQIKFQTIYEELTGEKQGLPLGDVFEILGKEKTLQLLR